MMGEVGYRWFDAIEKKPKLNFEDWLDKNYSMRLCNFCDLDQETKDRVRDVEYENYKKQFTA